MGENIGARCPIAYHLPAGIDTSGVTAVAERPQVGDCVAGGERCCGKGNGNRDRTVTKPRMRIHRLQRNLREAKCT